MITLIRFTIVMTIKILCRFVIFSFFYRVVIQKGLSAIVGFIPTSALRRNVLMLLFEVIQKNSATTYYF